MVGSVAEWLRHLTGNLETPVQFLAEPHFHLRYFLGIALRIPTATIFASLARAYEHVRVQNVRDFPQTKPDSEINALFLSNEHGDPRFFFRYLLRTI